MSWEKITILRPKIVDYLLSTTHMAGRSKARFFRNMGYDDNSVELLESQLTNIARSGKNIDEIVTPFGNKYVIDGTLDSPTGARVTIRTVWIEEPNTRVLQFVTAYPRPRMRGKNV